MLLPSICPNPSMQAYHITPEQPKHSFSALVPRTLLLACGFALLSCGLIANYFGYPALKSRFCSLFVTIFFGWSVAAATVDNFTLLDHEGKAHKLYYLSDAEAVVIMVHGNSCPIVRHALTDLRELRDDFQNSNVHFLLLNSVDYDNRESIQEEAEEWDIDFPILDDQAQIVGMGLGLTHTAEVLVIDPTDWSIKYRGPVNDRLEYERQKAEASEHYVADTLKSMLAGEDVEFRSIAPKGCLINLPDRSNDKTEISYSADVAPTLLENCGGCHVTGGIAPWAMVNYEIVRSFAPTIRQVLREKRMPPWHADPHVGEWKNSRDITPQERQLIVRWIDAGAPRGEGPDPLAEREDILEEWPLGPPDYIVEFPEYEVQATGVVEYQYFTVDNHMEEDAWLRAVTVVPGDTRVLHHVLMGTISERASNRPGAIWSQLMGGYAPGTEASGVSGPDNAGLLVRKGTKFRAQMHYTPIGKVVTDKTRVGLYFFDEPPETIKRSGVVLNTIFEIPPNTKEHRVRSYLTFHRDATLHSLLPHSHYRGKSSKFALEYPDGTREILLSVPNYDFNWQTRYEFVDPVAVPAGARLHHETIYDNSVQNPANPDPERTVPWGQQSWDEMLFGSFIYTWDGETIENQVHDTDRMRRSQAFGYLDRDVDGLLKLDELVGDWATRLREGFDYLDADDNNGLDLDEFIAALSRTNR